MAKKFTAAIQDFADLTERQIKAVVVDAVQDVLDAAQTPQVSIRRSGTFEIGKIPVDEGDLIQSIQVGYDGAYGPSGQYVLSAAEFSLGDTINARWTAAHALPMELGFTTRAGTNVPGRHFVGANAAKWPQFVAAQAAKRRV